MALNRKISSTDFIREDKITIFRRWTDEQLLLEKKQKINIMCLNFAKLHNLDDNKFIRLCEDNGLALEEELNDVLEEYNEKYKKHKSQLKRSNCYFEKN